MSIILRGVNVGVDESRAEQTLTTELNAFADKGWRVNSVTPQYWDGDSAYANVQTYLVIFERD